MQQEQTQKHRKFLDATLQRMTKMAQVNLKKLYKPSTMEDLAISKYSCKLSLLLATLSFKFRSY